jgi:TolB-like protein/Flp pilus assembly protein TadD
LSELNRRNVIRVGAAYAVTAWLIIQIAETIFPLFGFGPAPARIVVIVLTIGSLPALVFAWVFEFTPEGLKWEKDIERPDSITKQTGKHLDRVIMIVLALGIAYFAFDKFVLSEQREAIIAEQARQEGRTEALGTLGLGTSVAVLAFVNRSPDPEDAYFADGLADELLGILSRVRELKVASRISSFYFKDRNVELSEIASKLGVGAVLSGSVQREQDRIRVTVTLDQIASDTVLWSQSYDREIDNLLDVQTEIAQSVATAIVPVLSPASREIVETSPTSSFAAYDLYLRGREILRGPSDPAAVADAIELFDDAIAEDPAFAQAWAGRCSAYLSEYQHSRATEAFENAEAACFRALNLDDAAYEVRSALGNLYLMNGQFEKSAAEFQAGLEVSSNTAPLYVGLARAYFGQDKTELAEQMFLRAEELDNRYWLVHNELGIFYAREGRFDEALGRFRQVIELTPDSAIGYDNLAATLLNEGQLEQAKAAFEQSPAPTRWTYENRALVYYYLGEFDKAVEDQKRAVELAPDNHKTWGDLADAYRHAGDEENARNAYETAIELAEESLVIYPDDANTIARLGTYLAYTGQAEAAEELIQKVIDSDNASAYYSVGRVKMHHGDMDAAYDYLRKAIAGGWDRSLVARDPDLVAHGGEDRYGSL